MIVEVPDGIEQVLVDVELAFNATADVRRAEGSMPPPRLPVTIGHPLCWPAPFANAMVVRFACSLRPERGSVIEWARFEVEIEGGAPPIAADLYPMDVVDEAEGDVTIVVSPHLRFLAVDAELGKAEVAFKMRSIRPVVSAFGGQDAVFGWDLHPGQRSIAGVHHFFALLVDVHDDVRLHLAAEADVRSPRGHIWRGRTATSLEQRSVALRLADQTRHVDTGVETGGVSTATSRPGCGS